MQIAEFIARSNQCQDKDELTRIFQSAVSNLGFEKFIYTQMRVGLGKNRQPHQGVILSYPDDWMKHYVSNNYINHDPTYRRALQHGAPFTWGSLLREVPLSKKEKHLMHEAADAGLHAGTSLSIHGPYGEVMGFGFASSSRRDEANKNHLSLLYAIANQFHLVFSSLSDRVPVPDIKLSDKQKEVLQWAAASKSRAVIAIIMGISVSTVDDHFRCIFKKLDCQDRTAAILKAIQFGLIGP